MHKLTVTLKQHTPLIHFQHDQEGATLRASEVKPKLDKFIIARLTDEQKAEGRREGWLKEKDGKSWLDYKMRIVASDFMNFQMNKHKVVKRGIEQKDELQRPLYTTDNYPSNTNSIVMSNIGGRIEEDVFNFKMARNEKIEFILKTQSLENIIAEYIYEFVGTQSFGNRTTKGFGSFSVAKISNHSFEEGVESPFYMYFTLLPDKKGLDKNRVLKDVFSLINLMWRGLKRETGVNVGKLNNVLLNVPNQCVNDPERIPSALIFKPVIDYYEEGDCGVTISLFYNNEVINASTADQNSTAYYENLINGLINSYSKDDARNVMSGIMSYEIEELEYE